MRGHLRLGVSHVSADGEENAEEMHVGHGRIGNFLDVIFLELLAARVVLSCF